MKTKTLIVLALLSTIAFVACSLNSKADDKQEIRILDLITEEQDNEPHRFGGWYCPDNLLGFPAVDIAEWKNVPVINGRMATKAETQTSSSLIFVDPFKYPDAKPLDMEMPRLAKFYCHSSKREELIIVIQAIHIQGDSIVGFRYLNGGNGSSKIGKVNFLSDAEINTLPKGRFVKHSIDIKSNQKDISDIMRSPKHTKVLQSIFDQDMTIYKSWRKTTNLNFIYENAGIKNAAYADVLFGNFYIQNDFDNMQYTEKFLLLTNELGNITTLHILSGPYANDYDAQLDVIKKWAKKVKELSENS